MSRIAIKKYTLCLATDCVWALVVLVVLWCVPLKVCGGVITPKLFSSYELVQLPGRYGLIALLLPVEHNVTDTPNFNDYQNYYFNEKNARRVDFKNKKKNSRNKKRTKPASTGTYLNSSNNNKRDSRNTKEKKNNVRQQLGCQAGILSSLTSSFPTPSDALTKTVVKEALAATALFASLYDCTTKRQAASILYLYFEKRCTFDLLNAISDYLKESLEVDILANQDGETKTPEPEDQLPEWLKSIKALRSDWKSAVGNAAFKQVSTLLSMAAALGMCDLASLKFDVNGIRLFSIPTYKKHLTCFDFVDAAIDTAIYFIEGGYKCFMTGSLRPFIFSNDEARQLDKEYFEIMDLAPFMKTGTMEMKKNVSENDFDYRLNKAIDRFENMYHAAEGTFDKGVIHSKLMKLRGVRSDFISVRCDGKLREAPYGFYVHGAPGVGKSTISAVLMRVILVANGYDASDDRILTLNESDRFEPTYRGYINGVHFDDWGQTLPKFAQKSPVEKVFEFVNNVAAYANMPEADLKGKIPKQPKVVGATGNLFAKRVAEKYTESAAAAVRRFLVHAEAEVKAEFRLDDGRLDSRKAIQHYGGNLPPIPDLWDITVRVPDGNDERIGLSLVKVMTLPELVEWVINDSKIHFLSQKTVVEYGADLDKKLEFCTTCKRPATMCTCKKVTDIGDNQSFEDMKRRVRELLEEARRYESPWLRWTNYVPDSMWDNYYFDAWITYMKRQHLWNDTIDAFNAWRGGLFIGFVTSIFTFFGGIIFVVMTTWVYLRALLMRKRMMIAELRDMNGAMPELFRHIRDNHVKTIAYTGTALGALYMIVRAYRLSRTLDNQGELSPTSYADIKARDAEVSPWANVVVEKPAVSTVAATMGNMEVAISTISPNVAYFEIEDSVSTRFTDCFAYKGTYLCIPGHVWRDDAAMGTLWRFGKKSMNGSRFASHLHREYSSVEIEKDLYMIQFDNVQPFRDISEYISPDYHRSTPAVLVYRSPEGDVKTYKTYATQGKVANRAATFDGYSYVIKEGTFNGLCMAPLISDTVSRQVIGLHLGGSGNNGGAIRITRKMLQDAEAKLNEKQAVLKTPAKGVVLTEQYGKNYYLGTQVHEKSPTRFLPADNVLNHYGSVVGRITTHSNVVRTPISNIVEEVCGVPNKWGKPQFHYWKPWRESLLYSSKPSVGVEVELLTKAIIDYKEPLIKLIKDNKELNDEIRPLSKLETVCGKDGVRFIDKMKPNTSVGFPLSGAKSQYLTELDPEQYPEHNYPQELDPMFWEEAEKMKECYRSGKSYHAIFKACLKDEPTPLDKEKVRVFQAAPIALQLLIRQYYLPIARLLSVYPLVSECAVGINAQGPEWNQLRNFVTQYGSDRILAGDYSKYDLRMPAQMIKAAFRIMSDIAKSTGNYSEDDLLIMTGIASEVAYPTMAYNGDLLGHVGSNPSGQNLTVYINSIVNSLLFRCAWFHICGNRTDNTTFRDVCALVTYGDDAKSSVKEGWDEFNHLSYANFLKERDMKFTMPDKTSTPTAFMTDADADFLKRKNIWNSRVKMYFGALDEDSIFKSLHTVLHSSAVSPSEVAAMNIDGALREWFAYGEEHYERRRKQMIEVAERADLTHVCRLTERDYESLLIEFGEKYDVTLDCQSGELGDPTGAELEQYATQKCVRDTCARTNRPGGFRAASKKIRTFERRYGEIDVLDLQSGIIAQQSVTPPYMCEEHQLNELTSRLCNKGLHLIGTNVPCMTDATLGEVDALFEAVCPKTGRRVIVLVEAKMRGNRKKAMAQLGKYGLALAILQPNAHIVTLLMTGRDLEEIGSFNGSFFDVNSLFE